PNHLLSPFSFSISYFTPFHHHHLLHLICLNSTNHHRPITYPTVRANFTMCFTTSNQNHASHMYPPLLTSSMFAGPSSPGRPKRTKSTNKKQRRHPKALNFRHLLLEAGASNT
ncbi:hypothetical protein VIGAN_01349600, partial [Vigna angularis var. angularis]